MKFIDMNDDRVYTLQDLRRDWAQFRQENPEKKKNGPVALEMARVVGGWL